MPGKKKRFLELVRGDTVKHTELGVSGTMHRTAPATDDGDDLVRVRWASGSGRIRREFVRRVR